MGFFSDLKDDLSQAVNEMMPEEEGSSTTDTEADALPDVDLSSMLDRMETMDMGEAVPTETAEAEPVVETYTEPEPVAVAEPEPVSYVEPEPIKYTAPEPVAEPVSSQAQAVAEYLNTEKPVAPRKQVLDETAVITLGMEVNGDISTQGSLELVGRITGNITALGKLSITGSIRGNSKASEVYAEGAQVNGDVDSEGAVKIGQSTVVIGNISATSAVIAGAVKGDIDVRGPVILDGSAIVMGNIKSKYVQINNGAVIEGMCSQCYADVNPTSFFEELKKSF